MRRIAALSLLLLAAAFALGCNGKVVVPDQTQTPCDQARAVADGLCLIDPTSQACTAAKAATDAACKPAAPATCAELGPCPEGRHCELVGLKESGGTAAYCFPICGEGEVAVDGKCQPKPSAPKSCTPNPCPADKPRCLAESVHGDRSGPPETWTEGVMVSCHEPLPLCDATAHRACYHDPDGKGWRYRCKDGTTDVAVGPKASPVDDEKTCPAAPPVALPEAQPYLADEDLVSAHEPQTPEWLTAQAGPVLPIVSDAVRRYQAAEPGDWRDDMHLTDPSDAGQGRALDRVTAYLRPVHAARTKAASGQVSDAIFVEVGGVLQQWHLFGPGGWANSTGAMKGVWRTKPAACGDPKPPGIGAVVLHVMGTGEDGGVVYPNRTVVSATQLVCDRSYCDGLGFQNRNCCPVRQEGDPTRVACEALWPIAWTASAGFVDEKNPAVWVVPVGAGSPAAPVTVTACVGAVCSSAKVAR